MFKWYWLLVDLDETLFRKLTTLIKLKFVPAPCHDNSRRAFISSVIRPCEVSVDIYDVVLNLYPTASLQDVTSQRQRSVLQDNMRLVFFVRKA